MIDPAALLMERAPERSYRVTLRMSSLGKCARALSYGIHEVEPDERMVSRSERLFGIGDHVEAHLVEEVREVLPAGWALRHVGRYQRPVSLTVDVPGVGPVTVWGHPDGEIEGPGVRAVLEVKSTNTYAFGRWKDEGWPATESYYWQHQAYLAAAGCDRGYVLALCKESAAVLGWWTHRDPEAVPAIAAHLAEAHRWPSDAHRTKPDGSALAPKIDRHKTRGVPNKAHGELPWECAYCPYAKTCWAAHGLVEEWGIDWRKRPKRTLRITDTGPWEPEQTAEPKPPEAA